MNFHSPDWILLGAAFWVVFASAFTPGPNNTIVMTIAARFGFRRAVPWICGVSFGKFVLLIVIGTGLNEFLSRFSWAHDFIKIFGGCFLLYMAYGIAFAKEGAEESRNDAPGFWRGTLFQWINAKVWIAALSLLGGFARPEEFLISDVLYLALLLSFVAIGACVIWGFFGTVIKRILKNPRARIIFNGVMGGILAAMALSILFIR